MTQRKQDSLHRDDLDMDAAEAIVSQFHEMFPGCKVQFAGDSRDPNVLARAERVMAAIDRLADRSAATGRCVYCDSEMPNYPKVADAFPDDWRPAEGWTHFTNMAEDEFMGWQCPACGEK